MSFHVRAAPPSHHAWLAQRQQLPLSSDFVAIEAIDERTGAIAGMVGFERWVGNSVFAHVVLDSPAAGRRLLRPAFQLPFEMAGKGVLLGLVASDNAKSLKLARHLGFRELQTIQDGHAEGVHLVLFEMRREDCRFLEESRA